MILSSISTGRRAADRDPQPYVDTDGTRHATDPWVWVRADGTPAQDGDTMSVLHHGGSRTYAPRPEYRGPQAHPANPILDSMRDSWDDAWGSALAWGFAVASALDWLGSDVPDALGYRPGMGGSGVDLADGSYETAEVVSLLDLGIVTDDPDGPTVDLDPDLPDEVAERAQPILTHALLVLERLMALVPEADRY